MRNALTLTICGVVLFFAAGVEAQQTLQSGRIAKFKNATGTRPGVGLVKFVRDETISSVENLASTTS